MLTNDELLELLREGESDRVKFTSEYDEEKIRQNVCAFSNDFPEHNKPGVLFIGVNDDGSCAGMPVTDKLLVKLSELSRNAKIHPFPIVASSKKTLNGCEVAVVEVAPSHFPPVEYDGDIWVRFGPTCWRANHGEEKILINRRRGKPTNFDRNAAVPRVGIGDLDIGVFHEYLKLAVSPETLAENDRTDEERLKAMGFMTPDGEAAYGGLLCFGKAPQEWLSGAYIQFLCCPGTEIVSAAEAVDHQQIYGNIFQQIREIESLMKVHTQTSAIIGSPRRVNFPAYPAVALQQAIRNAVLHRSYEGTGAPIRCYFFSDRVEINSPGGPYGQVTVARFGEEGLTDYRNEMLAKVMNKANFIERFGFGIRAIRSSMKDNGNPEPEFRVRDTNVIVVLRKLDLDALAAKAAELACCGALFRFKRDWRANPGNASIRISSVSQLGGNLGLNEATASPCGVNPTAKDAAIRAVREYTKRRPTPLTVNAPVDSALIGSSPLVRMARIMCLLREFFGAEEGEMQEALKESFICRTPDEEKVRENDDREFRQLLEAPPALSEMEADIARELDDDRMRALIGD